MNNKICFVTVIFPGNLAYFKDFITSLENQSISDFDLIIFNDGVPDLSDYLSQSSLHVQVIDTDRSIAGIRSLLLNFLRKSTYELCVFGDSDDYFPENRIEKNLDFLAQYDLIVNDLVLVDQQRNLLLDKYLSQRLPNAQVITYDDIKHKNVCGLGNTAIRVSALPDNLDFSDEILAIDWVLFSRMLLGGCKAVFTNETYIYYRQHTANSIGLKDLSKERVQRGIDIKYNHYLSLNHDFGILHEELKEIKRLKNHVSSEENLTEYFHKIISLNISAPLWWEEIKTLNEI